MDESTFRQASGSAYEVLDFLSERFKALIVETEALYNEEDAWTFWDNDISVAWGVEESYHGRLAAIYETAGWEKCYHRDGAYFHYDVKAKGNEAYQGLRSALRAANLSDEAYDRVSEVASLIHDGELESWWDSLLWEDPLYSMTAHDRKLRIYSCGRSGGYVSSPRARESDPVFMITLAYLCEEGRKYFNSHEYGAWLGEEAITRDREDQLLALASPRPERVEA